MTAMRFAEQMTAIMSRQSCFSQGSLEILAMQCKHKPLYHLSFECHDGEVFSPRRMDKDAVMEDEDWKTPRVCVSTSVDGALSSILDSDLNPIGKVLWVHVVDNLQKLASNGSIYKPSTNEVPDADVTGEHWLTAPAKLKAVGQIEVTDIAEECVQYVCSGYEDFVARFKWKWI